MPQFAAYLEGYPRIRAPAPESVFYWSKENIGRKPVISVTHVSIIRGENRADLPEVLVAGKQVFATHYMNGALALTAVVGGRDGAPRYLVYLNRSRVDMLGGFLGWVNEASLKNAWRAKPKRSFKDYEIGCGFGAGAKSWRPAEASTKPGGSKLYISRNAPCYGKMMSRRNSRRI